jgi:hypothetical protein
MYAPFTPFFGFHDTHSSVCFVGHCNWDTPCNWDTRYSSQWKSDKVRVPVEIVKRAFPTVLHREALNCLSLNRTPAGNKAHFKFKTNCNSAFLAIQNNAGC